MENAALNPILDSSCAIGAGPTLDLGDLVLSLVSLKAPSRSLDHVVEAMLGGDSVRPSIGTAAVTDARWLSAQTPAYTQGGSAVSVLARRRGYRLSVERWGSGTMAEARNIRTGEAAKAIALTEGGAAAAAVASLAARENSK